MRSDMTAAARRAVMAGLCLGVPASAGADWVAAAFLGHAHTVPSTVVLTQPARQTRIEIVDVNYRGESFKSPQYYGIRMTWVPDGHRWMGIEGEFIHAKVFAETRRDVRVRGTLDGVPIDGSVFLYSHVQRLAMSHGLNFIFANFVVRHELGPTDSGGTPRLAIVGRAGAGPTRLHVESTIENATFERYENGGLGAQLGGGLEVSMWRGLGVVGEYKLTWAHPRVDVAGGRAEIPSRSHHGVVGLKLGF
jgi:lipid A oxidase